MEVELKCAGVPYLGLVAEHYWFVTHIEGHRERWELWQKADAGRQSVGHLHRNLMHPDSHVGGGHARTACRWSGESGERIIRALHESWDAYPYRYRYDALRGPNSNTYAAWVLRRADIAFRLPWRAIGRHYV